MLPAGVVLTGGGCKTPGLVDMVREKLKLPVQIGIPTGFEGLTEKVDDTSYSTALDFSFGQVDIKVQALT